MGEKTGVNAKLYWQVSALALAASATGAQQAVAEEAHDGLTLELQGEYAIDASGASETLPSTSGFTDTGIKPRNGYDVAGKLTYQQAGSPMSYALGIRYGRTRDAVHTFNYSYPSKYGGAYTGSAEVHHRLSHVVVDFEVGKDVGLGMGPGSVTTVGAGLRYAHFDAVTRGSFSTSSKYGGLAGSFKLSRRTDAFGPRIFIRSTTPIGSEGFSFGWGAGGAVLFGKQKVHADLNLTYGSYSGPFGSLRRSKSQTIPTVDAYAQLNWHAPSSPITLSAGYRVDAYFKAVDGGVLDQRRIDMINHGPFVGLIWKLQ